MCGIQQAISRSHKNENSEAVAVCAGCFDERQNDCPELMIVDCEVLHGFVSLHEGH